jgi:hypothetical protein
MRALARHWGKADERYLCDLEYPILSRLYDAAPARRAEVGERVHSLADERLPQLFRVDETCGLSLLELEAKSLKGKPDVLTKRFLARRDWPLTGAFLHLYWTIAEQVHDTGTRADAEALWTVLKDKGPAGSPEVQFAKARLDPTKTEFERMWE